MRSVVRIVVPLALALAVTACSGGGGGSSVPPSHTTNVPNSLGASPTPAASALPSASSSPAASATPTLAPQSATAAGHVVDLPYDGSANAPGYSVLPPSGTAAPQGAALAATDVYLGPVILGGATAPATVPNGFVHARTDQNGDFSIALAPGRYALTAFGPAPHVAVLHRDVVVASGAAPSTLYLTVPSANESAWFAQVNADRASFGVEPLTLDEAALEAARYWAAFMSRNGYFAHCIPASACEAGDTTPAPAAYGPQDVDPQHRFAYFHGFSGAGEAENIAAGFADWSDVEAAFVGERSACPNGSPADCTFSSATGHFLNIVDANYAWGAVAIAVSSAGIPYYDQEFSLIESASPTGAAVRSLGARDVRGLANPSSVPRRL